MVCRKRQSKQLPSASMLVSKKGRFLLVLIFHSFMVIVVVRHSPETIKKFSLQSCFADQKADMDLQKMIRRSLLSPLAQAQAQEKASQSLIGSTASTLCCAGKAALLRPIKSHVAFTFYTTMQYTNDINGEITVLRGTNFVTNLGLVTELTHEKWPAGGIEGVLKEKGCNLMQKYSGSSASPPRGSPQLQKKSHRRCVNIFFIMCLACQHRRRRRGSSI